MKAIIQRVAKARVLVNSEVYSEINKGILLLVGIGKNDSGSHEELADKVVNLRIFPDKNDKMDKSLLDINGDILIVSQFTLYSNVKKGRRPSFTKAMEPQNALNIYNTFCDYFKTYDLNVKKGSFGNHMDIEFINSGPVTLIIDEDMDLK